MPFAVQYIDQPGSGALRAAHRDAHIAYRKGLGRALLLAGPLLDEAGAPVGSLVLLEAASLDEARAVANADPYVAVDLFAEVRVHGYRIMANNLAVEA
jgi:uncharacterized protein